jgi:hypothetical protein
MSEPLTSNEIEDVLSSIRRLVSDELRPSARGPAAANPASALLLTPALRVVGEPSGTEAPAVEPAAPEEAMAQPETQAFAPPADDVLTDPAENAAEVSDPWEMAPPVQDYEEQMAGDEGFSATADESVSSGPVLSSIAGTGWDDGSEVFWSAPGLTEDHDAMEDAQDHAPHAASATGHWSTQEVPEATWAQEEPDWAEAEPPTFTAHPRKATLASDPLARAWADRAEAEVRADLGEKVTPPKAKAPPQEPPRAAAAPDSGLFDGSDPELDEEALRDIVRDIIREELAGTLGERITRNVRKLVRVEINRALTAREFD